MRWAVHTTRCGAQTPNTSGPGNRFQGQNSELSLKVSLKVDQDSSPGRQTIPRTQSQVVSPSLRVVVCWGMLNNQHWGRKGKALIWDLPNFWGLNTPAMTDFRLLMWCQRKQSWEYLHSCPVWAILFPAHTASGDSRCPGWLAPPLLLSPDLYLGELAINQPSSLVLWWELPCTTAIDSRFGWELRLELLSLSNGRCVC